MTKLNYDMDQFDSFDKFYAQLENDLKRKENKWNIFALAWCGFFAGLAFFFMIIDLVGNKLFGAICQLITFLFQCTFFYINLRHRKRHIYKQV